ncbi:methyltransferase domain-containing protein [Vineibacter terrae]|uniref:Methyltransferase domain-containing protein n=1 Tax=Vineibacter terrae TaxID=2586908 RepID=A0A5C8PD20_9HYPH|nr:transcription antitermination factor NusB [Vineibacter terrae]TXL71698.1 methyltransferase domain-containing protein [Vineibacter terrae]
MSRSDPATDVAADPLASRRLVLQVLDAVLRRAQPLEDTLARHAAFAALDARDRGFVRLLLATVLRRLGEVDAVLAACLEKGLPETARMVVDTLRIGVAQLLFLDTPAHAAVDTSVRLVAGTPQDRFKGVVNGVLRRVAREGASLRADAADAARLNTPAWLWQSWTAAYGAAAAQAVAAQHLCEAPLDFSLRDPATAASWAAQLGADILPGGTLRRAAGGRIEDLPGYADGTWWVQDAAAALPARLLGDVAGRAVVDLCAAPGGKTLQLLAMGAQVTAVDISARRLARLADNLRRAQLTAELVTADAARWQPTAAADAVLLDAPCSATGTLRRHPDIARTKGPADVARLAAVQDRLLAAAAGLLRPGGLLVYAVCSLQPEEGPQRVAAALHAGVPLETVPIAPDELPGLADAVGPAGDVRTLPSFWAAQGGMDGFYVARLRRRG